MADYYPLLARALDGLPDATAEARADVYERAKTALASQLRSVQPSLGEPEIARESASLEDAIARIERGYADFERQPADAAALPDPALVAPTPDSRIARNPAIRRGGKRGRSAIFAVVLVLVITPLAVLAWLWRDQPAPVREAEAPRTPVTQAPPTSPSNDPKFPERVGGPARPGAPPATPPQRAPDQPVASGPPPASSSPQAPPSSTPPQQPELAVAQRAALVEENTADPQQPKVTSGRALWRLDAVNGGQGQPLETVVRANIDVPDAGVSLLLTIRRNRDATLPASHTIDLAFTTTKAGDSGWIVRDVNPPLLRQDDGQRGVQLAALSVPVKENLFLIGLSDLRSDIERNSDMLLNRNWIELPLRFASGARATLVFEKGVSGDRVVSDAFKQWAAP